MQIKKENENSSFYNKKSKIAPKNKNKNQSQNFNKSLEDINYINSTNISKVN